MDQNLLAETMGNSESKEKNIWFRMETSCTSDSMFDRYSSCSKNEAVVDD
jgi:hypothetical protein